MQKNIAQIRVRKRRFIKTLCTQLRYSTKSTSNASHVLKEEHHVCYDVTVAEAIEISSII